MADDNGGEIGGDGSVKWEMTSGADDAAHARKQHDGPVPGKPNGKKCVGVDTDYGSNFVVSLRTPAGMTPQAFLASLRVVGQRVVAVLPLEPRPRQILIRWGKDPGDGSEPPTAV
jgi:hypothetical protein